MKYKRILKYFIDAHATNDQDTIDLLLKNGLDLTALDKYGTSYLILSCNLGASLEMTKFLLQRGAAVNLQSPKNGYSALHYSVENKRNDIIEELLRVSDIQINNKDHCGFTSLMLACKLDNEMAVKLLLRNGADINERSTRGNNALLWTVHNGNVALTKLLLENGANIKATDDFGNNAFIKSCRYGNRAICELLLQYDPDILDSTNDLRISGVMSTFSNRHYSLFAYLLDQGAEITQLRGTQVMETLLHHNFDDVAERTASVEICSKLICRNHEYFKMILRRNEVYNKNPRCIPWVWTKFYVDMNDVYVKAKYWNSKRGFLMFIACYGFIPLPTSTREKPQGTSSNSSKVIEKVFGNESLVRIIARYL